MKLYRVHLPHHNANALHDSAHGHLRARLADLFGGFTSWQGLGFWRGPDGHEYYEPVTIYEVASNDESAGRYDFRAVALAAGAMMKEKAVYVVIDGVAEIIDL